MKHRDARGSRGRVPGTLAGIATLAAGSQAYAGTVLSSVTDLDLDLGTLNVDIDGDGASDFRFFGFYGDPNKASLQPLTGSLVQAPIGIGSYYQAVEQPAGSTVDASALNRSNTSLLSYGGNLLIGGTAGGADPTYVVGSLSVEIVPPGYMTPGVYYEYLVWLKFDLTDGNFSGAGKNTLVAAGYNTIKIGDPGGDSIFVPEPASPAAFALGAVSVLALRRSRRTGTSPEPR